MSDFNIENYISNLAYVNKDFNSIWEEIMEVVPKLTSKWIPGEANESDPLVVLLKELGIVSDKLNYNIDKNILESFPDTLTQLRAAHNIFTSMGYMPEWYRSALTNVTITYDGGAGEEYNYSNFGSGANQKNISLPCLTEVCDENSNSVYTLLEKVDLEPGKVSATSVLAMEGTINNFEVNGSTLIDVDCLDSNNRLYFVQSNVAQNGIFISFDSDFTSVAAEDDTYDSLQLLGSANTDGGAYWKRVNNLHQQLPGCYCYQFGLDPATGSCYIQFPEDIGTLIGDGIYIKYILSSGEAGNIAKNTLEGFLNSPEISFTATAGDETLSYSITSANLQVSNSEGAVNGKDPETIAEMQAAYKRVVGTFDTLVTINDYESYLYDAEDSYGRPLISNIRVGDRTNDLYSSYKLKSLDVSGEVKTDGEVIRTDSEKEDLNAFQLRFYPLMLGGTSVTTKEQFDRSFIFSNVIEDKDLLVESLKREVEDTKAILHDYMPEAGAPIFLDYQLSGQIYLQRTLTAKEAEEVRKVVVSNLYSHLNSRQLTYGKQIDYQQVVDWIKESDPRIQYVALNPITYSLNRDDDAYQKFEDNCGGLDIQQRSVLAGTTPWTTYDNLSYYWGASDYSLYSSTTTVEDNKTLGEIKSIAPKISPSKFQGALEDPKESTSRTVWTVGANETLHILVPEYIATTTYTNYLYAVCVGIKDPIPADTPYRLGTDQFIYIFEERPDENTCSSPGSADNIKAVLKSDTIIKSNVVLGGSSTSNEKYCCNKAINLSSSITISVMERDISTLQSTYATESASYNNGLKIATNSADLVTTLKNAKKIASDMEYTLNIGEYLLWTNNVEPVLEIGMIGEGNTIVVKAGSNDFLKLEATTADYNSESDKLKWCSCKNGHLKYKANTIYSFGENYQLKLKGLSSPLTGADTLRVVALNGVTEIEYGLYDSGKDSYEKESTLPAILDSDNDSYQCSWCLALTLGTDLPQKLLTGQEVVVIGSNTDSEGEAVSAILSDTSSGDTASYIGASKAILSPGGSPLQLSDVEAEDLIFQTFTFSNSKEPTSETYFQQVVTDWKTPNIKGYYIFPAIFAGDSNSNTVYYILAKEGQFLSTMELKNGVSLSKVGPIFAVAEGAKYWKATTTGNASFEEVSGILGGGNYKILDTAELYVPGGMPIYSPSSNSLIADPWAAESFFNAAHVCNRYVLPRLRDGKDATGKTVGALENLKISTLSIKES